MKKNNIEKRVLKIIFNKSGGTAVNGVTSRITIPTKWIKELEITEDNREVYAEFDGETIIIRKKS